MEKEKDLIVDTIAKAIKSSGISADEIKSQFKIAVGRECTIDDIIYYFERAKYDDVKTGKKELDIFFNDLKVHRPDALSYYVFMLNDFSDIPRLLRFNQHLGVMKIKDFPYNTRPSDFIKYNFEGIVKKVFLRAQYDIPLLIVGETGTTKESTAKIIHELSRRREKPFIGRSCLELTDTLFDSLLFGYKKGAYTGAIQDAVGILYVAHKGTLFLDELGKLSEPLQAKLLRVIETKEFYRIGEHKPTPIDIRFLAAIQPQDIACNKIIPDLLYRLGYPDTIELPTLNERMNESPMISCQVVVDSSLSRVQEKLESYDKLDRYMPIDLKCLGLFLKHNYIGNYRELENILRAAVISAIDNKRTKIIPEDLKFTSNREHTATIPKEDDSLSDVPLKDIFDYAKKKGDKLCAVLVERKVGEHLKNGDRIKSILVKQGYKHTPANFSQQVKKITKKSYKEIVALG